MFKFSLAILQVAPPLKGNGDHSEVRDKFCSNFQNILIRSLWTENCQKNMGSPIHIRKLGGATYWSINCQNPKNKNVFKYLEN